MVDDRAPIGLLIAALGAAVLAISVFMPWYGVRITPAGAASAQQELNIVAQQYGNAAFQAEAKHFHGNFSALTGRELFTVSAHEVLSRLSPLLLFLAALGLLATLFPLAGITGLFESSGSHIALVGGVAGVVVGSRMHWQPGVATNFVSLSLRWGSWLALLSSVAIVAGGVIAASRSTRKREALGYIPHGHV